MYICRIAHRVASIYTHTHTYTHLTLRFSILYKSTRVHCDDCYISHARNKLTKNQQNKINGYCPCHLLLGEGYTSWLLLLLLLRAKYYHWIILSLCYNSVVNVCDVCVRVCACTMSATMNMRSHALYFFTSEYTSACVKFANKRFY